jgi:endonuclease/exonuclease/phosphatase family metal-dependent hydrolase
MRSRIGVLLLAGTLLATALASTAGAPAATAGTASDAQTPPAERGVRVASFNIHHGVGLDGLLNLERIAAVVERTGADVVGLQEVDNHWSERSNFVDQARWLADRLDMHVVFGANLDLDPPVPGAPRRQYGTAILSAHKIRASTNTLLPRPLGGEQRGLLEAQIKVRGIPVRVFNTHLQHDSQVERLAQVDRIRQVLATADESVVLLGDLNATPETPEIAGLTDLLVDAWLTAGVGDGFTFDAATPHTRIDYVMSSGDIVARTAAVVTTDSSDHLPVVADLALPGQKLLHRG